MFNAQKIHDNVHKERTSSCVESLPSPSLLVLSVPSAPIPCGQAHSRLLKPIKGPRGDCQKKALFTHEKRPKNNYKPLEINYSRQLKIQSSTLKTMLKNLRFRVTKPNTKTQPFLLPRRSARREDGSIFVCASPLFLTKLSK